MEYGRVMIYFSTYKNGIKIRPSGYAGIFVKGEACDVQIYYRSTPEEYSPEGEELRPIYIFRDGMVVEGEGFRITEGMATAAVRTGRQDFMQSGRCLEELEVIYIDGVPEGICGGRIDGQELSEETAITLTDWMDTVTEVIPECNGIQEQTLPVPLQETEDKEAEHPEELMEQWTLAECMERFPEWKLPYDGIRQRSCRMSLEDLGHLPKEWKGLQENHFLLHGYYEYHHLLLIKLCSRCGEKYAVGVPGEFCYRNQYMAEVFGIYDFSPLEQGKRGNGSFGYWLIFRK